MEKRSDTIHYFRYYYETFPYEPYVSPFGWVGLSTSEHFVSSYLKVDSKHYDLFVETAEDLKNQVIKKLHRHITDFQYGESFSYDTIVYELHDKYFDALQIFYDKTKNDLIIQIVRPYVTSSSTWGDRKNYKILQKIDSGIFLNKSELDKIINNLEWKKSSRGILIIDKKSYFLLNKNEKEDNASRTVPNFLDDGFASKENYLARIFEDAIAQYLSSKYGYQFSCRMKPSYLDGKELDIFGEKGVETKTITICECKLRFNDSRITLGELDYFHKKILKVKQNEAKRGEIKFHFNFITNLSQVDADVKEFASQNNIEINQAILPSNWQERADWKITEIKKLV